MLEGQSYTRWVPRIVTSRVVINPYKWPKIDGLVGLSHLIGIVTLVMSSGNPPSTTVPEEHRIVVANSDVEKGEVCQKKRVVFECVGR